MATERKITKEQVIEWGLHNPAQETDYGHTYHERYEDWSDGPTMVVDDVFLWDHKGWDTRLRVFMAPDDGKMWGIQYETNWESGIDEFDEGKLLGIYTARRVRPVTRTVVEYKDVEGEE